MTDESGDMGGDLAKTNRATMCQDVDQSSCSEVTNVFLKQASYYMSTVINGLL